MNDAPYQVAAQTELAGLVQGRIRLFALGLGGLNALIGLLNLLFLRPARIEVEAPLAIFTMIGMVVLAQWLRVPRPSYLVDLAGGTAAVLAVAAALLHLSISGDVQNTSHLMLIVTGAGFFLFSLAWYLFVSVMIAVGWVGVMLTSHPTTIPLHYGIEVGTSILLGLLIHLVRRDLLNRFLDLLIQKRKHEAEQSQLMAELREAMDNVKTLRGLIPICAECKKIRNDQGYWQLVEEYVHDHSEAVFSHSLCPGCLAEVKAEFEAYQKEP